MSDDVNELDSRERRPADPPYWPGDESGYEQYHRQMYTITPVTSGFVRWKILSTGINVARQLAGARNRGRDAWVREHGPDPEAWPLPHPPAVIWMPHYSHGACLRCMWLDDSGDADAAAGAARRHAASFLPDDSPALRLLLEPLPVWQRKLEGEAGPRTAG